MSIHRITTYRINEIRAAAKEFDIALPAQVEQAIKNVRGIKVEQRPTLDIARDVVSHLGEKNFSKALADGLAEAAQAEQRVKFERMVQDQAEKHLRVILWQHRDDIARAFFEPLSHAVEVLNESAPLLSPYPGINEGNAAGLGTVETTVAFRRASDAWEHVSRVLYPLTGFYPAGKEIPGLVVSRVEGEFASLGEAVDFDAAVEGTRRTVAGMYGRTNESEAFLPALVASVSPVEQPFGLVLPSEFAARRTALDERLVRSRYEVEEDTASSGLVLS